MDQPIDQRDATGGVGKNLIPLCEGAIGGDQGGLLLIPPGDNLEQQVGMAVGVGEIAHFVDHEELWPGIAGQAAIECAVAILGSKIIEHLPKLQV